MKWIGGVFLVCVVYVSAVWWLDMRRERAEEERRMEQMRGAPIRMDARRRKA